MPNEPDSCLPEYDEVAAKLARCPALPSPSEAHGLVTGLLVAGVKAPRQAWEEELFGSLDPADVLANECRSALDRVFAAAEAERREDGMQLTLLLPAGIAVDRARLIALSDWVEGFLFGLGLAGESLKVGLSSQGRSVLADIAEFARLDVDDADDNDEQRAMLIEVEEFLREGVLLIDAELAGSRQQSDAP